MYAQDLQEFESCIAEVSAIVDIESKFPQWPFGGEHGYVWVYEFDLMLSGLFGQTLQLLGETFNDEEIIVVDPSLSPSNFSDEFGYFPALRIPTAQVGTDLYPAINATANGRPIDAFIYTAKSIAIVGASKRWAVYGQRDWEVGLLLSPTEDGPWLHAGAPVDPKEVELSVHRSPAGWGMPISPTDEELFARNLRTFGSGPGAP